MRIQFLKKKLLAGMAIILLVAVIFGPIASSMNSAKSSVSEKKVIKVTTDESKGSYTEVRMKKVIWTEEGEQCKEIVKTTGSPPHNWESQYKQIRKNAYEHSLRLREENQNPPEKVIQLKTSLGDSKENKMSSLLLDGDWVRVIDWSNPWADAWAIGNGEDYATISKTSGRGEAGVPDSPFVLGSAGLYISPLQTDPKQGIHWDDESRPGRMYILQPSKIKGSMFNKNEALISVWIEVEEYDASGEYLRNWKKCVLSYTGYGNVDPLDVSLHGCYLDFNLETNHIYTIEVWANAYASCGSGPEQMAWAEIKPVEFKTVGINAYYEEPVEINVVEPEKGAAYVQDQKVYPGDTFPITIMLYCYDIRCKAHTKGGIDSVKFRWGNKEGIDQSSDNGDFYYTFENAQPGFGYLHVRGYIGDNEVGHVKLKIIKIP